MPVFKTPDPPPPHTHVSDFNSTISKEIVQKSCVSVGGSSFVLKTDTWGGLLDCIQILVKKLFPPGFECRPIEKTFVSPPPTAYVIFGWSLKEDAWNEKKQTKRIGKQSKIWSLRDDYWPKFDMKIAKAIQNRCTMLKALENGTCEEQIVKEWWSGYKRVSDYVICCENCSNMSQQS